MKYRVLKKCSLVVEKNSIVELDPMQAKIAKGLIAPIEATEEPKETKKKTTKKKGE